MAEPVKEADLVALLRAFKMDAKGYRATAAFQQQGLIETEASDEAGYPQLTPVGVALLRRAG